MVLYVYDQVVRRHYNEMCEALKVVKWRRMESRLRIVQSAVNTATMKWRVFILNREQDVQLGVIVYEGNPDGDVLVLRDCMLNTDACMDTIGMVRMQLEAQFDFWEVPGNLEAWRPMTNEERVVSLYPVDLHGVLYAYSIRTS
jgi:hypothetical protein